MQQHRIGVVLSGAGHMDGAEIQESTLALYFLDKLGAYVQCLSIDKQQHHVMDHCQRVETTGSRNVLEESARIARGQVVDIQEVDVDNLDGLILPGGLGVVKNLSDYAFKGTGFTVDPKLTKLIKEMHDQQKPMGFICIAPVIAAKLIPGVTVTIGTDPETANNIEVMGAKHVECQVDEIAIDEGNKVITTPAYMFGDAAVAGIATGIEQLVIGVLDRVQTNVTA